MEGSSTAQVRHVTSRANPLLKQLRRLAQDPDGYRRQGRVLLEGDHLCRALLTRGLRPSEAVVSQSAWSQAGLQRLALQAPLVTVVDDAALREFSALESPGGLAFVFSPTPNDSMNPDTTSMVLDRVQDAGNVGAMLRAAAAMGVVQVIALKGTAALWSPKVLRAGMGAHFGLRLLELAQPESLAQLRVPLLATSSHSGPLLNEVVLPQPCAWVFGHEGQGICADVSALCAHTLRIPQPGGEESLNVACAAAICLYESARQAGRLKPT